MKKWLLYTAWAMMYAMCAVLGFISEPQGVLYWIFLAFSLFFFVPPGILTYQAVKKEDIRELKRIRLICLIWLGLTVCLLALNFLSVGFTAAGGKFVYWLLIIGSSPMICGQIWVIPIFLWGCLLSAAWQEIFKRRK
ncbi:MAG: hypothetical protein IJE24_04980 [Oscillospiraceae bacterium]|nr:hypothetical protein [Oscillospiraceae bacterium]